MESRLALAASVLLAGASPGSRAEFRVLGTDRDFEGLAAFAAKPVVSWQWTPEEKQKADQFSRVEIVRDSSGAMLWTLKVSPSIPFKRPYLEILNLGTKYFPPEADALRVKVKAVSGKMAFSFGGPTAYFGNSDAFLRPVCVDAAADGPEWRTVEFSLHYGLLRNFRRASYSGKAPWIYYARWAQEPTFFYLFKGSGGEIHLKDLELVSQGLARPFPTFRAEEVVPVASLAGFASPGAMDQAFTALVGENDKEFEPSWNQQAPVPHPPAELGIVNDPEAGSILHSKGRYFEETSAVGVALSQPQDGDGLRFRVRVDTETPNLMVPSIPCQPLDLLLYEVPDPARFDFAPFLPSAELRKGPGKGYGRNLAFRQLQSVPGLSMAIYHARRFLPKGEWTEVTVPFADFLCIYGCGSLVDRFQRQLPLDPRRLMAVAILAPWPRKGRFETAIDLRDITLVKFKGGADSRRSYFQFPDVTSLRSVKTAKGGFSFLLAPGESELPPAVRQVLDALE